MPLHKPYNFVGLGRTNNYLEELFVGSTRHQVRIDDYEGNCKVFPFTQNVQVSWSPYSLYGFSLTHIFYSSTG